MTQTELELGTPESAGPSPEPPAADDKSALARWTSAQRVLVYFFIGVVAIWLLSGIYKVGAGEVALVERMGQFLTLPDGKPLQMEAGLHYHIPWPVDHVYIVPLEREQLLTVADFDASPASYEKTIKMWMRAGYSRQLIDAILNPYLITGDENVLHAKIAVQYRISNPLEYLTSVYQPRNLPPGQGRLNVLRLLASHELILKLAGSTVNEALYSGKQKLEMELFNPLRPQRELQAPIDKLGLGVQVQKVLLEYVHWPSAVDLAFTAVLNARQQESTEIQNAMKIATRLTTLAQGRAQAILHQANAAARQRVNQVQGEAREFSLLYAQYLKHPRVITLKLLSDTLGGVMRGASRVFFVQPHQQILLSLPPPARKIIVPASP